MQCIITLGIHHKLKIYTKIPIRDRACLCSELSSLHFTSGLGWRYQGCQNVPKIPICNSQNFPSWSYVFCFVLHLKWLQYYYKFWNFSFENTFRTEIWDLHQDLNLFILTFFGIGCDSKSWCQSQNYGIEVTKVKLIKNSLSMNNLLVFLSVVIWPVIACTPTYAMCDLGAR